MSVIASTLVSASSATYYSGYSMLFCGEGTGVSMQACFAVGIVAES